MLNSNCDGGCCLRSEGEVRVLPTGGSSNLILCRACYEHELAWRRERNRELGAAFKFELPTWDSLEIYPGAP
jgi:hypothetical protein